MDNRKFGGTGLGLTISKHLSKLMGGEMGVESQQEVGSKFWFTLLLEKGDSLEVVEAVEENEEDQFSIEHAKVLLVEDNPINQQITKKVLENMGVICTVVENGRKAIDCFLREKYDLILMDCEMPVLNGYEATVEIRQIGSEESAKIPIVALTANAMDQDRERCLAVGMTDYMAKPFDKAQLQSMLRKWLFRA